jgi:hypothetical protein
VFVYIFVHAAVSAFISREHSLITSLSPIAAVELSFDDAAGPVAQLCSIFDYIVVVLSARGPSSLTCSWPPLVLCTPLLPGF